MTLKIYTVNVAYLDYLRTQDKHVMIEKPGRRKRKYIGILLEINNSLYVAPLSSPKDKHQKMKNTLDCLTLGTADDVLGVININNMIPVKQDLIKEVVFKDVVDIKYRKLLMKQYQVIKKMEKTILTHARLVYMINQKDDCTENELLLKQRSCDFKGLEKMLAQYKTHY